MIKTSVAFVASLFALLCLQAPAAFAQTEEILSYHSDIRIDVSGTLRVTETIRVVAAGREIKRGIFRDFPTSYRDRNGHRVNVGFSIASVQRDGRDEPYHTELIDRGVRTYIGDKDVILKPGVYTYTLTYRTDRQIGFFDEFDELYWNVTGNGWSFPIQKASATVELPPGAELRQQAAYTGPEGAQDQDYVAAKDAQGNPTFTTTKNLPPHHGLTIAVAWQKGIVQPPGPGRRAANFIGDNGLSIAAGLGAVLLLVYYFFAWLAVGRDPAKGTIIPLYFPPQNLSPGACRFIERMGFDDKIFAATLVNLAVKGYLRIDEKDRTTTLRKIALENAADKRAPLTEGERKTLDKLFATQSSIELKNKNHAVLGGAKTALRKSMQTAYELFFFRRNRLHFFVGIAISVLTLIGGAVVLGNEGSFGLMLWLSVWTVGCFFLVRQVFSHFGARRILQGVVTTVITVPFVGAELVAFGFLAYEYSWVAALAVLVTGGAHVVFHHLLKAPTHDGRRVMDQIEGFRLYLSIGERDRLTDAVLPERTTELFERYLPYALALGVEQKWAQQFAGVLAGASADQTRGYAPNWYSGHSWTSTAAFSSALAGTFASTLSSAATAPGSSSGSGGGGSSGGGGGGGGGGGW